MNDEKTASDVCLWAKYVSILFSPVLIPTYCVVIALWITPMQRIAEDVRMVAAFTVLILTALAPTLCIATMIRLGKREGFEEIRRKGRILPTAVFMLSQLVAAYYLYRVCAPVWLVMILVAGAALAVIYIVSCFFIDLSGHMCAMGSMCAVVYFMAYNHLTSVFVLPWLIGVVVLAGLVGTARLQQERHDMRQIVAGFVLGTLVTYAVMNLHLFDQKIPQA